MNIKAMLTADFKDWDKLNPADKLRAALVLAITAPDDTKAEDALNLAKYFARFCTDKTIEQVKRDIEQDMSKGTVNNAA